MTAATAGAYVTTYRDLAHLCEVVPQRVRQWKADYSDFPVKTSDGWEIAAIEAFMLRHGVGKYRTQGQGGTKNAHGATLH